MVCEYVPPSVISEVLSLSRPVSNLCYFASVLFSGFSSIRALLV